MIRRLHELQTEEAESHSSPTETAQNLPQDPQVETTRTSSASAGRRDTTAGEDVGEEGESSQSSSAHTSKSLSRLGSALKTSSGSGSTRLLPSFVYQAGRDSASGDKEDRQGGRGGGKKRAVKENGRKAKQKLNLSSSSSSVLQEEEEEPASSTSWSEMSSMVIGCDYRLSPLSPAMEQRLILQYLTPLGDYQEVRSL